MKWTMNGKEIELANKEDNEKWIQHQIDMKILSEWLNNHDWYYQMSDDHRYWKGGEEAWKKIKQLAKKIGRDGERLMQAHYDYHYHPGAGFQYKYKEDE